MPLDKKYKQAQHTKNYIYSKMVDNIAIQEPRLKLHQYQERAIKFGLENKTVFFAMDLGLGKTAVSLKIIQKLKQKAIVFAPLRGIYVTWPDEIKKWTPEITYDIIHGPNKRNVFRKSKADILLVNYDGLKWFMKEILSVKPRTTLRVRNNLRTRKTSNPWVKRILILDESSMAKSPTTLRFKMLKKMINSVIDFFIIPDLLYIKLLFAVEDLNKYGI